MDEWPYERGKTVVFNCQFLNYPSLHHSLHNHNHIHDRKPEELDALANELLSEFAAHKKQKRPSPPASGQPTVLASSEPISLSPLSTSSSSSNSSDASTSPASSSDDEANDTDAHNSQR
jgi:hypothetical protein